MGHDGCVAALPPESVQVKVLQLDPAVYRGGVASFYRQREAMAWLC